MGKGVEMKNHKTCESCIYLEKNDCTNPKVENLLFTYKDFGCVFWEVNSRNFYANGIRMREEGMNIVETENYLTAKDPAPSPVKKKQKWPPRMKVFKEPKK